MGLYHSYAIHCPFHCHFAIHRRAMSPAFLAVGSYRPAHPQAWKRAAERSRTIARLSAIFTSSAAPAVRPATTRLEESENTRTTYRASLHRPRRSSPAVPPAARTFLCTPPASPHRQCFPASLPTSARRLPRHPRLGQPGPRHRIGHRTNHAHPRHRPRRRASSSPVACGVYTRFLTNSLKPKTLSPPTSSIEKGKAFRLLSCRSLICAIIPLLLLFQTHAARRSRRRNGVRAGAKQGTRDEAGKRRSPLQLSRVPVRPPQLAQHASF